MINEELTKEIIACAYEVFNTLGSGFLEKVYENALVIELENAGFDIEQQAKIDVYYEEEIVGDFFADIIVDDTIILELLAVENLHKIHEIQLVNYLSATDIEIGLLINFGNKVEVKRKYKTYKPKE